MSCHPALEFRQAVGVANPGRLRIPLRLFGCRAGIRSRSDRFRHSAFMLLNGIGAKCIAGNAAGAAYSGLLHTPSEAEPSETQSPGPQRTELNNRGGIHHNHTKTAAAVVAGVRPKPDVADGTMGKDFR